MIVTIEAEGTPIGVPILCLAAAAVVVTTAVIATAVVAAEVIAAAAGEQQDQDDDPPAVIATKTIVTHKNTSKNFLSRLRSRSFQDIPEAEFCAAGTLAVFSRYALKTFGKG